MSSVLFICTANQCRSPVAEALFLRQLKRSPKPYLAIDSVTSWHISSMGTWAAPNRPAHRQMRKAAQEIGIDLSQHRARAIEHLQDLMPFRLILVMAQGHKEALQIEFPTIAGRVYLLSEMGGAIYDIPDPIGGPLEAHRQTITEIERLLTQGWERIIEFAE